MRRVGQWGVWLVSVALWSGGVSANAEETGSLVWAERQYALAKATTDRLAKRLLLEHLQASLTPRETLWFRVRGSLYALTLEGRG